MVLSYPQSACLSTFFVDMSYQLSPLTLFRVHRMWTSTDHSHQLWVHTVHEKDQIDLFMNSPHPQSITANDQSMPTNRTAQAQYGNPIKLIMASLAAHPLQWPV